LPSNEVAIISALAAVLIFSTATFGSTTAVVAKAISVESTTAVPAVMVAASILAPAAASTTVSINSIDNAIGNINSNDSCSNSSDNSTNISIDSHGDIGCDGNGVNSYVGNGYC